MIGKKINKCGSGGRGGVVCSGRCGEEGAGSTNRVGAAAHNAAATVLNTSYTCETCMVTSAYVEDGRRGDVLQLACWACIQHYC